MAMKTRLKISFILWIASIISTLLVLPYVYNIQHEILVKAGVTIPYLILLALIQGIVFFGIASFFGIILAEKTGFRLPLLTSWLDHKKINFKKTFWLSIILGLLAGIIIFLFDKFIFLESIFSFTDVQPWAGFLASFYGGIAEEVIMRLFLMSLLVFILMKIFRKKDSNPIIIWVSIIAISIIFGLGHLPITASVVSITPMVIFRAIILNGIGGVIFGWLYWKKGLESAIIAHFCADIVLHVIGAY